MKKIILLISALVLLANCKGSDSSSDDSSARMAEFNNFISDNRNDLGELANHILDNYPEVSIHYKAYDPLVDANSDERLFYALRALVNTHIQADSSERYNVDAKTPMQAWADLTDTALGKAGVDSYGLSIVMADVLESFGITTRILTMSGVSSPGFSNGEHTVLEVQARDKWVIVDSKLNTMYSQIDPLPGEAYDVTAYPISAQRVLDVIAQGGKTTRNPTGYSTVAFENMSAHSWNNYYKTYRLSQPIEHKAFVENVWRNFEIIDYSSLSR